MKFYFLIFVLTSFALQRYVTIVKGESARNACELQGDGKNAKQCLIVNTLSETLLADGGNSESADSVYSLKGKASVIPVNFNEFEIESNVSINKITTVDCPNLENGDNLSQSELIKRLTASCRYDRTQRPAGASNDATEPVKITARVYIYILQNAGSSVQFDMQALLQLRYVDPRLAFDQIAPERKKPIQGDADLRNLIWAPHLFFANERDSSVLGTFEKDILTSISPDGTVVLATRIQATLFCWLQLKKFPFDDQFCTTTLESWMYNSSDLMLNWESDSPIFFNPHIQFSHYSLDGYWHNQSLTNPLEFSNWHGNFAGNYSSIRFTVHLVFSASYYVMDYFIPSMIMVAISWVSFWLRADQTPARTILNCSTMLSLITLSSGQLKASSSFIMILEVWFLACCIFIFCSLIEFAFSNSIYRRTKNVQLKKVNSKCILKSTVKPRRARPKSFNGSYSTNDGIQFTVPSTIVSTVSSVDSINTLNVPQSRSCLTLNIDNNLTDSNETTVESPPSPPQNFATMTPQEISLWLDKKSRFLFPVAFIIFNVFFWMFVLIL